LRAARVVLAWIAIITASCATPEIAPGAIRVTECLTRVLQMKPGIENVRTGVAWDDRARAYEPFVSYSFELGGRSHFVQFAVAALHDRYVFSADEALVARDGTFGPLNYFGDQDLGSCGADEALIAD